MKIDVSVGRMQNILMILRWSEAVAKRPSRKKMCLDLVKYLRKARRDATPSPVPKSGRTFTQVTSPAEIRAILAARAEGKTLQEIERDFGLKDSKGMTAYRIVKKHQRSPG